MISPLHKSGGGPMGSDKGEIIKHFRDVISLLWALQNAPISKSILWMSYSVCAECKWKNVCRPNEMCAKALYVFLKHSSSTNLDYIRRLIRGINNICEGMISEIEPEQSGRGKSPTLYSLNNQYEVPDAINKCYLNVINHLLLSWGIDYNLHFIPKFSFEIIKQQDFESVADIGLYIISDLLLPLRYKNLVEGFEIKSIRGNFENSVFFEGILNLKTPKKTKLEFRVGLYRNENTSFLKRLFSVRWFCDDDGDIVTIDNNDNERDKNECKNNKNILIIDNEDKKRNVKSSPYHIHIEALDSSNHEKEVYEWYFPTLKEVLEFIEFTVEYSNNEKLVFDTVISSVDTLKKILEAFTRKKFKKENLRNSGEGEGA